jgi:hypothetical protein
MALAQGGGMGGMGGGSFDPSIFMDPRARMKMNLAQSMIQSGTSTAPVYSPLAGIARALGGALGGWEMKQAYGDSGQQTATTTQKGPTTHEEFAKLLTANPTVHDWFVSLPEWRQNLIEINPPSWLSSYIDRQKLGPTDVLAGPPGTTPQTSGMAPDDLGRAVQWYNAHAADPNTPPATLQILRSGIAKQIVDGGFQPTFDDKGNVTYGAPQGAAAIPYVAQKAGVTAEAGATADIRTKTQSPTVVDGKIVIPGTVTNPPPSTTPPPPAPTSSAAPTTGSGVTVAPANPNPKPGDIGTDGKGNIVQVQPDGSRKVIGKVGANGKVQ